MANAQKYTLAVVGHMFDHYGRQEGDGVQRGNEEINPELTHENYNLAPTRKGVDEDGNEYELSQMEILNNRLSEVKHLDLTKRKDINVMADWVVTLPENVPREKAPDFFQNVYDFLVDRYGEENVISAWVHMDETKPHIHFSFVPVVKDEDGTERLCAKERISRTELSIFHPELMKYVEEKMGQDVAILNGATAGGNLKIIEMKMREALKKLAEVEAKTGGLETAKPIIDNALELVSEVTEMFKKLDEVLKTKKWFGSDEKAKMKALFKELDEIKTTAEKANDTIEILQKTLKGMNANVNKHMTDAFKQLDDMRAKAQRRIKRTETKLKRREERVSQREESLDVEIRNGVRQELEKLDKPIKEKQAQAKALDEEIKRKKSQIATLDVDFWSSQEFLRQAQRNQRTFTEDIERWRLENESQISKSTVPKR